MKKHKGLSLFSSNILLLVGCLFLVACDGSSSSVNESIQSDPQANVPAKVITSANDQDQDGIRDFTQNLFSEWDNFQADTKWTSSVAKTMQAVVDNYNTPNEANAVKEYWENVACLMENSLDADADLVYIELLTLSNSANREAYKTAIERSEIGIFDIDEGAELCA